MTSPTIIVGAGIAGLYTALAMAPRPVLLVTAGRVGHGGSSRWAQGGLAAAMSLEDSHELHLKDTLAAGAGLVDEHAARILCTEGPDRIEDLFQLGVPFDRDSNGQLKLGREAAHSRDRIVHVGGDEAGAKIMEVLTERAMQARHIEIRERTIVHRITTHHGEVSGIEAWDADRQCFVGFAAWNVVLATGGIGGLYAVTTNPLYAQGHGLAMAYEAGAQLRDLEFVQFHPTAIDIRQDPAPLATEAIRGEGATLHDAHGRRFMPALHPDAELAPRDVVARGVAGAIASTGEAFLDARKAIGQKFRDKFPTVYESCMAAGIDPAIKPIPVAPAAHYHMGGIATDTDGRSTVTGLWAVGECASTGVHGANRLASNSLLEALVFGQRAADALRGLAQAPRTEFEAAPTTLPPRPPISMTPIRQAMAEQCGLLREAGGLSTLLDRIRETLPETEGDRLSLLTAELIVEAALARTESRGAHSRLDYPETLPPMHTMTVRNEDAALVLAEDIQAYEVLK
ncbi:L-aspartate oxidase [Parvularcula marina]|uniref:L-aspartate oxidase n=1 Tax=Parvularcula marina TaxID=2292771 RepID=UPI003514EC04